MGEELQFAGRVQCFETLKEQPPEKAREHFHRQQELRPASNPALTIRCNATAGHDAMNMGMVAPTPTIP
jgi:hypothetical protein